MQNFKKKSLIDSFTMFPNSSFRFIISPSYIFWPCLFISINIILFFFYIQSKKSQIDLNFTNKNFNDFHTYLTHQISYNYPGKDTFRYCNPPVQPTTFSSPNDLCITSVFNMERNLALNLFSIRKSGCSASIFIFTDESTYFSSQSETIMKLFDITIVKGIFHGSTIRRHTDFLRDTLLYYFLKQISKKQNYDRVFFFDSFDVYFQSDPFEHFPHSDSVFLFQEAYEHLQDSEFNWNCVKSCFGEDEARKIGHKYVFCSGTIGSGSVRSMISFLKRMINMKAFSSVDCPYDQGFIIYMAQTEEYQKGDHYSLHLFPPEFPVASCKIGPIIVENHIYNNKEYSIATSRFPNSTVMKYAVVHQYTSNGQLSNSYNDNTDYDLYIQDNYDKAKKTEIPVITIDVK